MQLSLVWAGYAVVAAVSALLIFVRYLKYVENPQDAAAAGGMWAGGDLALELIVLLLFLVPTAALVFVIRKSDAAFITYAKVLLGLSVTAPAWPFSWSSHFSISGSGATYSSFDCLRFQSRSPSCLSAFCSLAARTPAG